MTPAKQEEIGHLLDATARRFAQSGCKTCLGKGYYLHNPVDAVTKTQRVGGKKVRGQVHKSVCLCAERGYKRTVSALLAMPCTHCGETGKYCEHRPMAIAKYMQICEERWAKAAKTGGT